MKITYNIGFLVNFRRKNRIRNYNSLKGKGFRYCT